MDKGKIYKIINLKNNKVYIGCTIKTLETRYYEHLYRCFKNNNKSKLYNSIKKYGEANFIIGLIEECDVDKMYELEKKYITQYDSFKNGLNSTFGGEGCLGYTHSEEIRNKISKKLKEGNSHKGKTYDILYGERGQEEKQRRSETVKKYWNEITDEKRVERNNKIKENKRINSTYSVEFIKELKTKLKIGININELSKLYPNIRKGFFYELKNNRRWSDI
jgi:group I intron endonuclease